MPNNINKYKSVYALSLASSGWDKGAQSHSKDKGAQHGLRSPLVPEIVEGPMAGQANQGHNYHTLAVGFWNVKT